jgi:hypothetical protein
MLLTSTLTVDASPQLSTAMWPRPASYLFGLTYTVVPVGRVVRKYVLLGNRDGATSWLVSSTTSP